MELLGPERAGAIRAGDRVGADEHRLGATLDAPLELLDRLLDDGQRDHRGGVDAALVVEAPGLVEPLVEGVDDGVDRVGLVAQALLEEAGQPREQERPDDAVERTSTRLNSSHYRAPRM